MIPHNIKLLTHCKTQKINSWVNIFKTLFWWAHLLFAIFRGWEQLCTHIINFLLLGLDVISLFLGNKIPWVYIWGSEWAYFTSKNKIENWIGLWTYAPWGYSGGTRGDTFFHRTPLVAAFNDMSHQKGFNKVVALGTATLFKKRFQHKCFPANIAKFLRTPILKKTCQQLLLSLT